MERTRKTGISRAPQVGQLVILRTEAIMAYAAMYGPGPYTIIKVGKSLISLRGNLVFEVTRPKYFALFQPCPLRFLDSA